MENCNHPNKFNRYDDKEQYNGHCKKCGMKWRLYLGSKGTTLEYYNGA